MAPHYAKGFSLWLMPAGEVVRKLEDIIGNLAGRYGSPKFPPHITLLGAVECNMEKALEVSGGLSKRIGRIALELDGIGMTDSYFRSLFIKVKGSAELDEAFGYSLSAFGISRPKLMPHISLLYAELHAEEKERMVSELEKYGLSGKPCSADTLALYNTQGGAEDWRKVREFRL